MTRRHALMAASAMTILAFCWSPASVAQGVAASAAPAQARGPAGDPDFGPDVIILRPTMPSATIQSALDAVSHEDQFSARRHAVLFRPGTYAVNAQVSYYEQVAGLGQSPDDVVLVGGLTSEAPVSGNTDSSLDNFWRSEENLSVRPSGGSTRWAVSQGAPLRRMHVAGGLSLVGARYGFASGGYIADSQIDGQVLNAGQQQWFTRDSVIGSWSNAVWNQVFSGVAGAPAQSFPTPPYTILAATPVSREKPFLTVDAAGRYGVFAPGVKRNSAGTTWSKGGAPGRSIPIERFFIARPSTPTTAINLALALGRDLILTPGIYKLDQPIRVLRADTVVLGLGYATLVPQTGQEALAVADLDGVQIAGLLIDAGPVNSPVLFRMGTRLPGLRYPLPARSFSHAGDPSAVSDVFFRVGGATAGRAATSLEIDSADVVLDDIWAWRADHGNGVGWTRNTADHGLVVNGNDVTALGLAVEHYQKDQVVWNGNGGETVFYQSELPYDPPSQAAWMDGGARGYPSYAVAEAVGSHQAYGLGVYCNFDLGLPIVEDRAIAAPVVAGVRLHDALSVFLDASGSIAHVVNGLGGTASSLNAGVPQTLTSAP